MLDESTISINLAQTVNTKSDDKISDPNQMSIVKNARYTQDKRLVKRQGMTGQSLSFQGDPGFINPVAIQSGNTKSKVFAHENQLCMLNNGNLFSQYQGQNKWTFKGTCVQAQLSSKKLDPTISFTDIGTTTGVTAAIVGQNVWIIEEATGNIIAKNTLTGTEQAMRVMAFSAALYIMTCDTSNTNLYARQVTLSTGALGGQTTIVSDYSGSGLTPLVPPDLAITTGSAIGEAAFIIYLSGGTNKVVPFLSSGSTSALGKQATTMTTFGTIAIEPTVNANKFYVADTGHVQAFTFTSGAYTTVYSQTFTPAMAGVLNPNANNVVISLSPINGTDLYIFIDSYSDAYQTGAANYEHGFTDESLVAMLTVNASGTVTYNAAYGYGYMIAGKPIRDATRKSIYLPCVYSSALQPTILLMDMLEGKAAKTTYCIGKVIYGSAALPSQYFLPACAAVSSGVYRTLNNGYAITIDLASSVAQQSQYFARTTHITGGLLWAYDGQDLFEHNFLITPEHVQAFAGSAAFFIGVLQVGDASHPESFNVSFLPAIANKVSGNNYFQFNTTTTGYYVWYTVDGTGTNPAIGGRTGINVALLSTDSADAVASKTAAAITGGVVPGATRSVSGNVLTITNLSNGVVTAPAVGGAGRVGTLSAGSYEYCFVYKYTDRNNQIYRSAPSVPVSVTASANNAGFLTIWAPPITNKNVTSVSVEVYRTSANGSEFQLLTTTPMVTTGLTIPIYDTTSDTTLQSQTILYTNGDILENYNIGSCSSVSFFKERLVANLSDDPFAVYYSKSNVFGEPVNFTAESVFRVDADKNAVSATMQMDDKLCVFKKSLVYALSGDGADDLGLNSSFSAPMLVASDVGTSNPNSIVLFPNGLLFKSDKGIYELNRSLGVGYRGAPVESYNSNSVSSAVLMPSVTEIRFTLSDSTAALVYNYFFDRWDFFDNYQYDSACVWQDTYCAVTNAGRAYVESASNNYDYNGSANVSYSLYVLTPWLRLKGVQDFQRIKRLALLGEYVSPHTLTVNVYYDYNVSSYDTYTFDGATLNAVDGVYNPEIHLKRQKCESIRIEIYETPISGSQSSLVLNQCDALVGLKRGLFKRPAGKTA